MIPAPRSSSPDTERPSLACAISLGRECRARILSGQFGCIVESLWSPRGGTLKSNQVLESNNVSGGWGLEIFLKAIYYLALCSGVVRKNWHWPYNQTVGRSLSARNRLLLTQEGLVHVEWLQQLSILSWTWNQYKGLPRPLTFVSCTHQWAGWSKRDGTQAKPWDSTDGWELTLYWGCSNCLTHGP